MPTVIVVCPHCGSTGQQNHGIGSGSGEGWGQCHQCRKSFKIRIQDGLVVGVKK